MVEQSRRFVCIKINVDHDGDNAEKYRIEGVPTVLFVRSNGDQIEELQGRIAESVAKQMKKVADDYSEKKEE